MKRILPLLIVFLVAACGPQRGRLRIRGEYQNLPQADLLIYSPDGGLQLPIDTLHIQKGRFDYTTPLPDDEVCTYVIVYPNFMTLSFMAHGGTEVRIQGDALSLGQERVEGADSLLLPAPHAGRSPLAVGRPLPKNDIIRHQRGTYLLVAFWAEWKQGASAINFNTRMALAAHRDSLRAFTYSLDVDPQARPILQATDDTAHWHVHRDYLGWASPLVSRFGIRNLPFLILLDPRGRISAMGNDYNRDIKPSLERIGGPRKP